MIICMGVLITLIIISCFMEYLYENRPQSKYSDIAYTVIQISIGLGFLLWIVVMIVDMFIGVF